MLVKSNETFYKLKKDFKIGIHFSDRRIVMSYKQNTDSISLSAEDEKDVNIRLFINGQVSDLFKIYRNTTIHFFDENYKQLEKRVEIVDPSEDTIRNAYFLMGMFVNDQND